MKTGRELPTLVAVTLVTGCGLYIPAEEHLGRVDRDLDQVSAVEDCDDGDPAADVHRTWYVDADGDGIGGAEAIVACNPPAGHVLATGDCDDADPDHVEIAHWYADADHDGWGAGPATPACGPPAGHVDRGGDCDDADPLKHPAAVELCNLIDDDCDDEVDEDAAPTTWWIDADGDGWGDDATAELTCDPAPGAVLRGGDCDDAAPLVNPEAIEVCNGHDDDCDALVDDDDPSMAGDAIWYVDDDGDGWGNGLLPAITSCAPPPGYVEPTGDCDDAEPARNPAHDEICDGLDNDCDALVDDADPDRIGEIHHLDLDGDGFGGPTTLERCVPPPEAAPDASDCDDADPTIHPARAYEVDASAPGECSDGADNDCDGLVDAADDDCADTDGDGLVDGVDPLYALDCVPGGGVECLCARADLLMPPEWAAADAIRVIRGESCLLGLCSPAAVSELSLDDLDPLGAIDPGSWCWDLSGAPADTYVFRWVSAMSAADPTQPVDPSDCTDWLKIDLSTACGALSDAWCTTTQVGLLDDHVDTCDSGTADALEVVWDGSTL